MWQTRLWTGQRLTIMNYKASDTWKFSHVAKYGTEIILSLLLRHTLRGTWSREGVWSGATDPGQSTGCSSGDLAGSLSKTGVRHFLCKCISPPYLLTRKKNISARIMSKGLWFWIRRYEDYLNLPPNGGHNGYYFLAVALDVLYLILASVNRCHQCQVVWTVKRTIWQLSLFHYNSCSRSVPIPYAKLPCLRVCRNC